MASVSVPWNGSCASATDRDELLSYVKRLAELSDTLLTMELPDKRHPLLGRMTGNRVEGLKSRERPVRGRALGPVEIRSEEFSFLPQSRVIKARHSYARAVAEIPWRPRMPLPSDITRDPKPMVCKDKFGNMIILTRDGVAATFKDDRWQPGLLFAIAPPGSRDEFTQVSDEQERARILDAATGALREGKRR